MIFETEEILKEAKTRGTAEYISL